MDPINPEVMIKQVAYSSELLRNDFKEIDQNVRNCFCEEELKTVQRVYAMGDGDSWFAAMALEMAFREFAKVEYLPLNAMQFQSYSADTIPLDFPKSNLIIGISASGSSTRVVESIEKVQKISSQLNIAGLIGKIDSKLGKISPKVMHAKIPQFGPCPGILTYMASLLGLYSLALYMGEVKGHLSKAEVESKKRDILNVADVIDKSIPAWLDLSKEAAQFVKGADFISFAGSGPGYGTACFSGAKVVEAAGVFSPAQDLEEWAHVEGLAYPVDFPVFLIAQKGKGYWRAEKLAEYQKILGHKLIIVAESEDTPLKKKADFFLPVAGRVPEEFSPLVYFIPSCIFASYLARGLDRLPFLAHDEEASKRSQFVTKQIKESGNRYINPSH